MEYFRIKNWEKYQHRDASRYGRMPWIKLHTSMLTDQKIYNMTPLEGWTWVNLLLLTGEIGNKIPLDVPWLRARLPLARSHKALDLAYLWKLGLIEEWTAGLDLEQTKTKTKTLHAGASAPAQNPPKKYDPHPKSPPKKSGWVNPAQARLENNLAAYDSLFGPKEEEEREPG